MREIVLSNLVTLDGYFEGKPWEIDWHNVDAEFFQQTSEMWETVDTILFGRKTYQGMEAYWTSEAGLKDDPVVSARMSSIAKVVVSRTLVRATWSNSRVVGDITEVARLKEQPGKDLVVLGSSDLAASLLDQGLLDEIRIIMNPVLLGQGKSMFHGLPRRTKLELVRTRTFANGNVMLVYRPHKNGLNPAALP
jgi:dihydrofolate reductase